MAVPSADISNISEPTDLLRFRFEMSKLPDSKPEQTANNPELFQRLRPNFVRLTDNATEFRSQTGSQIFGVVNPNKRRVYRYVGNTLEDLLRKGTSKLRDQDKFLGHLYKFLSLSEIAVLKMLVPESEAVLKLKHQPFDDPFSVSRCFDVFLDIIAGFDSRRLPLLPEEDRRRTAGFKAAIRRSA